MHLFVYGITRANAYVNSHTTKSLVGSSHVTVLLTNSFSNES